MSVSIFIWALADMAMHMVRDSLQDEMSQQTLGRWWHSFRVAGAFATLRRSQSVKFEKDGVDVDGSTWQISKKHVMKNI